MAGDEGLEGLAPETEQTFMRNPTSTSRQPSNTPAITVPLGTPLSVAARELILSTLEHCGGERKRTAEMLGICTKTLYNRLREYGIREVQARSSSMASTLGDHSQATSSVLLPLRSDESGG